MDRKAFYNLEYGVFMLSSRSGEKLGGCIINTCFQAASGPARLAISCINGNYTPELIRESSLFDLTVLDRTVSFDTIRHFGMQSGRDTDKFASFEHAVDENGIPYLTKSAGGAGSADSSMRARSCPRIMSVPCAATAPRTLSPFTKRSPP